MRPSNHASFLLAFNQSVAMDPMYALALLPLSER
jgi:hypothetical protein